MRYPRFMADTNPLSNCRLAFIGCGVMAEAIIAGLLRKKLVGPEQIVGSHPRQARREEMHVKYGIEMFESNREAVTALLRKDRTQLFDRARREAATFARVLEELKGALVKEQLVVSIVAGAKIETIAEQLLHASMVRTMPNTPRRLAKV